jgi:hypothetical protein
MSRVANRSQAYYLDAWETSEGKPMQTSGEPVQEMARGWRVLVATAAGNGAGLAALPFYALSSFVVPLQHAFGWSRPAIGLAATVLAAGTFLAAVMTGDLHRLCAHRCRLVQAAARVGAGAHDVGRRHQRAHRSGSAQPGGRRLWLAGGVAGVRRHRHPALS